MNINCLKNQYIPDNVRIGSKLVRRVVKVFGMVRVVRVVGCSMWPIGWMKWSVGNDSESIFNNECCQILKQHNLNYPAKRFL